MKAQASEASPADPGNVIPLAPNSILLAVAPKPRVAAPELGPRFKIKSFTNASGTESWRVDGYKRDGTRVRQNFADAVKAQAAQLELETEYLRGEVKTEIKATKLSDEQISLAEAAIIRLGENWLDLPQAIEHWLKTGQKAPVESPRLDDAVRQFKEWLQTADFRERTKANLRLRVNVFANSVPNHRLADITADTIYSYLEKRNVAKASKDNDRRALSRFFGYCMDRPRKWIAANPARKETRERRTGGNTPAVLPLEDCETMLRAAEKHRRGRLVPYVALCLFGGLRPFEAARLSPGQINMKDREIRLEPFQTKTKAGRVVTICDTLAAWLKRYKRKPVYPANWRKDFDLIKGAAGYGNPKRLPKRITDGRKEWKVWPDDVLRHTAISHFFRKTGSYGLTAEQFGNSEAIIKTHYQGRVSSDDTREFYSILPKKVKERRRPTITKNAGYIQSGRGETATRRKRRPSAPRQLQVAATAEKED